MLDSCAAVDLCSLNLGRVFSIRVSGFDRCFASSVMMQLYDCCRASILFFHGFYCPMNCEFSWLPHRDKSVVYCVATEFSWLLQHMVNSFFMFDCAKLHTNIT